MIPDNPSDRIAQILSAKAKRPGMPIEDLAREAVSAGILREDRATAETLIDLLVRWDKAEAAYRGRIPRLHFGRTRKVGLVEWWQDRDTGDLRRGLYDAHTAYLAKLVALLLRKLVEMDRPRFEHVARRYVDVLGFRDLKRPERRVGADLAWSAVPGPGLGSGRTAILVKQAPVDQALKVETVVELRGTLHHFRASTGLILTTGRVGRDALDEALADEAAPITLLDGQAWVSDLVERGIGVRVARLPVPYLDPDLYP